MCKKLRFFHGEVAKTKNDTSLWVGHRIFGEVTGSSPCQLWDFQKCWKSKFQTKKHGETFVGDKS